ncbi:MAG: hypothetical protein ACI8Z1_002557 [Candidatus Azotimanducaceae bacterium]
MRTITLSLQSAIQIAATLTILFTSQFAHAVIVEDFDTPPDGLNYSFSDVPGVSYTQTTTDAAGITSISGKSDADPVLRFDLPTSEFAGVGRHLSQPSTNSWAGSQDWSISPSVQFWFYGEGNDNQFRLSLLDTNAVVTGGELWLHDFIDDLAGWKLVDLSFDNFFFANYSTLNNGVFDTETIYSWSLLAHSGVTNGTYFIDDIALASVPSPSSSFLLLFGIITLLNVSKKKRR